MSLYTLLRLALTFSCFVYPPDFTFLCSIRSFYFLPPSISSRYVKVLMSPSQRHSVPLCSTAVKLKAIIHTRASAGKGHPTNQETHLKRNQMYMSNFSKVCRLSELHFKHAEDAYTLEMLRTLVETEAHSFNLQEFNYISRYVALSRGSTLHLLLLS
jgi:hypothetical protein